MIACHELSAGYGGRAVVSGVDLTVKAGEILTFIGPNGCGKTTLLRVLAGVITPIKGQILYGDDEIGTITPKALALRRSYFAQKHHTPDMTVRQLVECGRYPHQKPFSPLSEADRAAVEEAMLLCGIADVAESKLKRLSGGQQQLCHLAMTVAQQAPVLFLDEPTTYLDIANRRRILTVAKAQRDAGRAVVMTMHDLPEALTVSDRIGVLGDEGVLLAIETPQAIVSGGYIETAFGYCPEQVSDRDGNLHYIMRV